MSYPVFPFSEKEAAAEGIMQRAEFNKAAQFPKRLVGLRKESGKTQFDVAHEIGVTKSTIGLYETGDTVPDVKVISRLADLYDVSTEYLLCRTETRSPDIWIQAICEHLGVDEAAVKNVALISSQRESWKDALNEILGSDYLMGVVDCFADVLEAASEVAETREFAIEERGDGTPSLPEAEQAAKDMLGRQKGVELVSGARYVDLARHDLESVFRKLIEDTSAVKSYNAANRAYWGEAKREMLATEEGPKSGNHKKA